MADILNIGDCKKCGNPNLTCKYNYFGEGELEIHAWEHKCLDCGGRQTTAYRSDDDEIVFAEMQVDQCPYCNRKGERSSGVDVDGGP